MAVEAIRYLLNIWWSQEESLVSEMGASQVQGRAAGEKGPGGGWRK